MEKKTTQKKFPICCRSQEILQELYIRADCGALLAPGPVDKKVIGGRSVLLVGKAVPHRKSFGRIRLAERMEKALRKGGFGLARREDSAPTNSRQIGWGIF